MAAFVVAAVGAPTGFLALGLAFFVEFPVLNSMVEELLELFMCLLPLFSPSWF